MKFIRSKSLQQVLQFAKPYKKRFNWVIAWAVFLSVFAAVRPYFFQEIIDNYLLKNGTSAGFTGFILIMAGVLVAEVVAQFYFSYWSNWLGQDIIRDIRNTLFQHISSFKMKYFDKEPVGKLVTRTVSDIESIASIFSQGLFMIVSDLLKMLIVLVVMFAVNWKVSLIVVAVMPFIIIATNIFQKKMKVAFNDVRNEVSNLNTFVQERLTGMKIVQLFNREKIELEKFKQINKKHNDAWLKNILYNSIFFPIADIISNITLGLVVYFGALFIIQGDTTTTIGHLISFNMYISMLYNPLRQIADKFNVMQMGIYSSKL